MLMSVVHTAFDFLSALVLLPPSPPTSLCHLHFCMTWKYLTEVYAVEAFADLYFEVWWCDGQKCIAKKQDAALCSPLGFSLA